LAIHKRNRRGAQSGLTSLVSNPGLIVRGEQGGPNGYWIGDTKIRKAEVPMSGRRADNWVRRGEEPRGGEAFWSIISGKRCLSIDARNANMK